MLTVDKHVLQHVINVYSQDVLNVRLVTMGITVRLDVIVIVLVHVQRTLDNVVHVNLDTMINHVINNVQVTVIHMCVARIQGPVTVKLAFMDKTVISHVHPTVLEMCVTNKQGTVMKGAKMAIGEKIALKNAQIIAKVNVIKKMGTV